MYDTVMFNYIDDIDHFTLAVRNGASFNREKAVYFIKKYAAHFDCVGELDERFTANGETFESFSDSELYDSLIKIRNAMSKNICVKGF